MRLPLEVRSDALRDVLAFLDRDGRQARQQSAIASIDGCHVADHVHGSIAEAEVGANGRPSPSMGSMPAALATERSRWRALAGVLRRGG